MAQDSARQARSAPAAPTRALLPRAPGPLRGSVFGAAGRRGGRSTDDHPGGASDVRPDGGASDVRPDGGASDGAGVAASCGFRGGRITQQGWVSLFVAAVPASSPGTLALLCVASPPAWLLVTGRPQTRLREEGTPVR